MMELKMLFEKAANESKLLSQTPSNEMLLQLYSLYKQSTEGDATEDHEPANPFDFLAKAKYGAWQNAKGKTRDQAMREYVSLVEKLK